MKRAGLACTALGAVVFVGCVLSIYLLIPRYTDFQGQELAARVNAITALLMAPGKVLLAIIYPPVGHAWSQLQQVLACLITVTAATAALYAILVMLRPRHRRPTGSVPPGEANQPAIPVAASASAEMSRRAFLGATTVTAAALVGVGSYAAFIEPGRLRTVRVRLKLEGLPESLHGLRIVQLTDLHYSECVPLEHLARVVREANALRPDIVLLTGDYVTHGVQYIDPVFEVLEKLEARMGVVSVLGNHDMWTGQAQTEGHLKRLGFDLLTNSRLFVNEEGSVAGSASSGLCLAGVGDAWTQEVNLHSALGGVAPGIPRLLLSHNPDVAENPALQQYPVNLMISGHTHGGQVRLPIAGTPIVPSLYGAKYAHGLNRGPGCDVYTSAGIGTAMLPIRLGVPPEIILFKLRSV